MKRYEDLDAELRRVLDEVRQQMTTTVISYPERNPRDRVWGANNYPGNCSGKVALAKRIEQMLGESNFAMIPSSIHEVIAVPLDMALTNSLSDFVKEVNQSNVKEKEQLSDVAYVYNAALGEFRPIA